MFWINIFDLYLKNNHIIFEQQLFLDCYLNFLPSIILFLELSKTALAASFPLSNLFKACSLLNEVIIEFPIGFFD